MSDAVSTQYADLLTGCYDCVDRIVLNAYHVLCYNAGGFRCWWRRLRGSDADLDNAHLMRMAGRFSRRVHGFATAHQIPVVECLRGERKHQLAEEYLADHPGVCGLFMILVSRAVAPVWEVTRSSGAVDISSSAGVPAMARTSLTCCSTAPPGWRFASTAQCSRARTNVPPAMSRPTRRFGERAPRPDASGRGHLRAVGRGWRRTARVERRASRWSRSSSSCSRPTKLVVASGSGSTWPGSVRAGLMACSVAPRTTGELGSQLARWASGTSLAGHANVALEASLGESPLQRSTRGTRLVLEV